MVGAYYAQRNWTSLAPDVVFVLNDLWYLSHYSRAFAAIEGRTVPMVGYLPLDGAIDDFALVREVKGFTQLMTYTNWAAAQLRTALAGAGNRTRVEVAGHGIDRTRFHPLGDDLNLASRLRRAQTFFRLDEPAFVVLNASRPDPRKRLDLTLDAFALFSVDKPLSVKLCLHQAIAHEVFVAPLRDRAERLGIANRLLWFPRSPGPLDDAALNELYNACAVGLNTAAGEGFGLVSFEHASTGAPQVLPAHPALCELWQSDAELVGPVHAIRTEHSPLVMGEVEPSAVAATLDRLYADSARYEHLARSGVQRCARSDFQWSEPAERLVTALLGSIQYGVATQ